MKKTHENEVGICQACLNANDKEKKQVKRATDDIYLCKLHWLSYVEEAKKTFSMEVASFFLN